MIRRPSPLTWLLALAVVLSAVWFVVGVHRAYAGFLRALASGDETGLERQVDFSALRGNFINDFSAMLSKNPPTPAVTPERTRQLVQMMADAAVTPGGLGQMVTDFGTSVDLEPLGRPSPGAAPPDLRPKIRFRFQSPVRVDVHVYPVGVPDSVTGIYTFELQGLRWRLTRVWSERIAAAERR